MDVFPKRLKYIKITGYWDKGLRAFVDRTCLGISLKRDVSNEIYVMGLNDRGEVFRWYWNRKYLNSAYITAEEFKL